MQTRTTAIVEAIGLGWALGLAYLTAVYFICYLAALPMVACVTIAVVMACLLTVVTVRLTVLPRFATNTAQLSRATMYGRLAAGACAMLPLAATVWMAVRSPLAGWDGWSIWAFKAVAFADGGLTLGYFRDPTTLHTHPDYPLNVSIAESLALHLPNGLALPLATLLGPACFAALLCLVYSGLARLYGASAAAVGTAMLAAVPIFVYNVPAAGADVPLSLYTGGSATYLLLWWTYRWRRDAVLACLMAGSAAWTKKEGLAIAAVTLGVYVGFELWSVWRQRRLPRGVAAMPLMTALAIPLPWLLFVRIAHPLPRDFDPVALATLILHLGRLPRVALLVGQQMLVWDNWGPFWIVLAIALLARGRYLSPAGRALIVLLGGQIGLYIGVFAFSNWQSYMVHAQGTLDRLLLQATPLAVLCLVACVCAARPQPYEAEALLLNDNRLDGVKIGHHGSRVLAASPGVIEQANTVSAAAAAHLGAGLDDGRDGA